MGTSQVGQTAMQLRLALCGTCVLWSRKTYDFDDQSSSVPIECLLGIDLEKSLCEGDEWGNDRKWMQ